MNRGLFAKAVREVALPTVVCSLGFLGFEVILARVMDAMDSQMTEQILRLGFVRVILQTLLGTDVAELGPKVIRAFAWVHPVILTLLWTHSVTICSRFPVGEVDAGTADVLLTFPASRLQHLWVETVAWIFGVLVLLLFGLCGHVLGFRLLPEAVRIERWPTLLVLVNLFATILVVGGLTRCLSALSSRRGRVVGIAVAVVLVSFFWNFVCQFWVPAKPLAFLSLLDHYQPMEILSTGTAPVRDLVSLGTAALVLHAAAVVALLRRDVATS